MDVRQTEKKSFCFQSAGRGKNKCERELSAVQLWHQGQVLFHKWIFGEPRDPEQRECSVSVSCSPQVHVVYSCCAAQPRPAQVRVTCPCAVWSQRKWLNLLQFRKTWTEGSQLSSWNEWSFWHWGLVFALQWCSCKSNQPSWCSVPFHRAACWRWDPWKEISVQSDYKTPPFHATVLCVVLYEQDRICISSVNSVLLVINELLQIKKAVIHITVK